MAQGASGLALARTLLGKAAQRDGATNGTLPK
jgi:hypothetical protein